MHLKEVIKVAAGSWPAGLHGKHKEVEGGFPRGPVAKTLASSARGPGSIPGQGTRSHMPQLTVCMLQLKIPPKARKIGDLRPSTAKEINI